MADNRDLNDLNEELEPKIKSDMGSKPPRATKEEIEAEYEPSFTVPSAVGSGRGFMGKLTQGGMVSQIIISVVIVGLAMLLVMPAMYVTQSADKENISNIVATIDTMNTSLTSLKASFSEGMSKLNGALNDIANIPSTIEHQFNQVMPNEMRQYEDRIEQIERDLNVTQVQEDLATISQGVANARSDISAVGTKLNNFIDTFTGNLTTLQEQIDDWDGGGGSSSSGGDDSGSGIIIDEEDIQSTILYQTYAINVPTDEREGNGDIHYDGVQIYYEIVNESNYDIKNIKLELALYPPFNENVPISKDTTIASPNIQWRIITTNEHYFVANSIEPYYVNPYINTLSVDARGKEQGVITMDIVIKAANIPSDIGDDITYYAVVNVLDYDIVD